MLRRGLYVLVFASALGFLLQVGCVSQSNPSPPTPLPTTVEYSSISYSEGDAIISGEVEGLGASLNGSAKDTSNIPTAVFSIDTSFNIESGVFKGDRFFFAVPAGKVYGLVFKYGDSQYVAYEDSTSGLHSVPLTFVEGASAAGTISITETDDALTESSSDINLIDLRTIEISSQAIGYSNLEELIRQLNSDQTYIDYTILFDAPISRHRRTIEEYDNRSYIYSDDLLVDSQYGSDQLFTDIIGQYMDPSLLNYLGFSLFFWSSNTTFASIYRYGDATIQLPIDVTLRNGETYSAGDSIPATTPADEDATVQWGYQFLNDYVPSGDVNIGNYIEDPTTASSGTYTVTLDNGSSQDVLSFDIEAPAAVGIDQIPIPVAKVISEGGIITNFGWKWMKRENGEWVTLTPEEVQAAVQPNSMGEGIYGLVNINSTDPTYADIGFDLLYFGLNEGGSDSSVAEGVVALDIPIPEDEFSGITVVYNFVSGFRFNYSIIMSSE